MALSGSISPAAGTTDGDRTGHGHSPHAPSPRDFGLLLEHTPRASATARHEARRVLVDWGLEDEQVHTVLLVVSELVTNAVTHARPPVILHLRDTQEGTGHVQVHVSDGGPRTAPLTWAANRADDEHGRGTDIVAALTRDTGTDLDGDGLIDHWATLSVD
ncbi:ATP-binding protein [Streptomyces sp. NPDC090303]|uniref:ATP-binding protein n=1 Tax=Streptomyces sp. NPDC090303 TaxID=3365960 RepID=UPI0038168FBF